MEALCAILHSGEGVNHRQRVDVQWLLLWSWTQWCSVTTIVVTYGTTMKKQKGSRNISGKKAAQAANTLRSQQKSQ